MDIISTLLQFVGGGVGVWLATEGVKKASFIPVNEGQTTAIRAVAGALSAIAVVLLAFVNKDLQPTDLQNVATAILGVAGVFLTSHGTHKLLK